MTGRRRVPRMWRDERGFFDLLLPRIAKGLLLASCSALALILTVIHASTDQAPARVPTHQSATPVTVIPPDVYAGLPPGEPPPYINPANTAWRDFLIAQGAPGAR